MFILVNSSTENYISGCNKILGLLGKSDIQTKLLDIEEPSLQRFRSDYPEVKLVYFLVASHPLLITYVNSLTLMGVRVINAAYFSKAINKYLTQQRLEALHLPIPTYRLWTEVDDAYIQSSTFPYFLKSFNHSVPVIKTGSVEELHELQRHKNQYTDYYLEASAGDSNATYVKCYAAFGKYSTNNDAIPINSELRSELDRIGKAFGLECFSTDIAIHPDGSHKYFDINYASAYYGSDEARSQLAAGIQAVMRQPVSVAI